MFAGGGGGVGAGVGGVGESEHAARHDEQCQQNPLWLTNILYDMKFLVG